MRATPRTSPRSHAMDLMRPSAILGLPAPATDDHRRWLRVTMHALGALALAASVAILLGAAR